MSRNQGDYGRFRRRRAGGGGGRATARPDAGTADRRGPGFLREWCRRHDGGPYPAYRDLRGRIAFGRFTLDVLRVQPDPYAGPSRIRLRIPYPATGLDPRLGSRPGGLHARDPGRVDPESSASLGIRDYLGRAIGSWLGRHAAGRRRSGGGPSLRIVPHGQEVLDRSAVLLDEAHLEVRLEVDLPARGRRILGGEAFHLLGELPERLVEECLAGETLDVAAMRDHAAVVEDFAHLQSELDRRGWVAFLADGSRLARRAGNDDRPLREDPVVEFRSPETLLREVELPHAGTVRGMAVEPGVTLLCGGGYHGKSTVLRAICAGVVPHIPGDGRERVASLPDAQAARAEDGRAISGVDLRPFIGDLPFGRSTAEMATENASGSTSQAAGILEAVQGGSRLLLIDEDTSATNFMIRDPAMDELLGGHREPITPFLVQARTLYEGLGVSTILVIGGSGEYFRVADRVLVLDHYRPCDETARAQAIAGRSPGLPAREDQAAAFRRAVGRSRLLPAGAGGREPRGPRVRALGPRSLLVDRIRLDLAGVEALRDLSQARFLAILLTWRSRELFISGERGTVRPQTVADLEAAYRVEWERSGIDGFHGDARGDLAAVRFQDLLAAVNRLRARPASGGWPPGERPRDRDDEPHGEGTPQA